MIKHTVWFLVLASAVIGFALAGPSARESKLDAQQYALQKPHLRTGISQAAAVASIARQLGPAAAKLYRAPFSYYLTDEQEPDAYSYYAGRVYVSQGMVDFADNREELAGVMCHESSHVLHHDGTRSDISSARYGARAGRFKSVATFFVLRYSRQEEEAADLSGATLCSQAGSNPWGIVWMLQKLQKVAPSRGFAWFADHPSKKARIKALTRYLKKNADFATWSSDPAISSTPLRR